MWTCHPARNEAPESRCPQPYKRILFVALLAVFAFFGVRCPVRSQALDRDSILLVAVERRHNDRFVPEAGYRCEKLDCVRHYGMRLPAKVLDYELRISAASNYAQVDFFSVFAGYRWHASMRAAGSARIVLRHGIGRVDIPLNWISFDPDPDGGGVTHLIDPGGPFVAQLRVTVALGPRQP